MTSIDQTVETPFQAEIDAFMEKVKAQNGHEPEFLQAVHEVAEAIIPFMADNPKYKDHKILEST